MIKVLRLFLLTMIVHCEFKLYCRGDAKSEKQVGNFIVFQSGTKQGGKIPKIIYTCKDSCDNFPTTSSLNAEQWEIEGCNSRFKDFCQNYMISLNKENIKTTNSATLFGDASNQIYKKGYFSPRLVKSEADPAEIDLDQESIVLERLELLEDQSFFWGIYQPGSQILI